MQILVNFINKRVTQHANKIANTNDFVPKLILNFITQNTTFIYNH